jgi:hypothetical protein
MEELGMPNTRKNKPAIPPGLELDPIAQHLHSMGRQVTRADWLMLDRGSSDESQLDPETLEMLNRMFPPTVY